MEEALLETWKNLKLMDDERKGFSFSVEGSNKWGKREQLCLLGYIVAKKMVNKEAFKSSMQTLWKLHNKVDFKEVGQNLYIVEFHELRDL